MQVLASKKALVRAISAVIKAADNKAIMPELANVRLSTQDGSLGLACTDLYVSAITSCEADVKEPGEILVPVNDLYTRVSTMPDGGVLLSMDTKRCALTIKADGANRRFTLAGLPGDTAPAMPAPLALETAIHGTGEELARLFDATLAAVSTDLTRANLNSLLVERDGKIVLASSTDGHRLNHCEVTTDTEGNSEHLIPLRGALEFRRALDAAGDKPCSLAFDATIAQLVTPSVTISAKLSDATFPQYGQVVPDTSKLSRVTVGTAALSEALRAISVVSAEKKNGGVALTIGEDEITIECSSPESGDGSDSVPVIASNRANKASKSMRLGANVGYLISALQSVGGPEETLIYYSGELDPVVLTAAGEPTKYGVLMPMRI